MSYFTAFSTMQLGGPYWSDPEEGGKARWQLAGVVALTLGTTGVRSVAWDWTHPPGSAQVACDQPLDTLAACSVLFNFLGRDFFNALSEKDAERFTQMLIKWLGGVVLGVPVFVFRDYLQASASTYSMMMLAHAPGHCDSKGALQCGQSQLALDWRDYMTRRLTQEYLASRTFYQIQAGSLIDNPDQRISSDVRCGLAFTASWIFLWQASSLAADVRYLKQVMDTADVVMHAAIIWTNSCQSSGSLRTQRWASP